MNVDSRLFDFMMRLNGTCSFESAWLIYLDALAEVGINEALYGWNPTPDDAPQHEGFLMLSNYNDNFMREYHDNNGSEHDVLIDWCYRTDAPLEWNGMNYVATDGQMIIEEISAAYQLEYGLTIPLRLRGGKKWGGTGLSATGMGRKEFVTDVKPHFEYLHALTHAFHMYVQKFPGFTKQINTQDRVVQMLTDKESSVLQWLCQGYSIQEIADYKIYRSVHSVDKYISQAKEKLNARNRDQLIAKALILNLI